MPQQNSSRVDAALRNAMKTKSSRVDHALRTATKRSSRVDKALMGQTMEPETTTLPTPFVDYTETAKTDRWSITPDMQKQQLGQPEQLIPLSDPSVFQRQEEKRNAMAMQAWEQRNETSAKKELVKKQLEQGMPLTGQAKEDQYINAFNNMTTANKAVRSFITTAPGSKQLTDLFGTIEVIARNLGEGLSITGSIEQGLTDNENTDAHALRRATLDYIKWKSNVTGMNPESVSAFAGDMATVGVEMWATGGILKQAFPRLWALKGMDYRAIKDALLGGGVGVFEDQSFSEIKTTMFWFAMLGGGAGVVNKLYRSLKPLPPTAGESLTNLTFGVKQTVKELGPGVTQVTPKVHPTMAQRILTSPGAHYPEGLAKDIPSSAEVVLGSGRKVHAAKLLSTVFQDKPLKLGKKLTKQLNLVGEPITSTDPIVNRTLMGMQLQSRSQALSKSRTNGAVIDELYDGWTPRDIKNQHTTQQIMKQQQAQQGKGLMTGDAFNPDQAVEAREIMVRAKEHMDPAYIREALDDVTTLDMTPTNLIKWATRKYHAFGDLLGNSTHILNRWTAGREMLRAEHDARFFKFSNAGTALNAIHPLYKKLPRNLQNTIKESMEGTVAITDPRMKTLGGVLQKEFKKINDFAIKGEMPNYTPRDPYFPQSWREETLEQIRNASGPHWNELKARYGLTKMKAASAYYRKPSVRLNGNLDFQRQLENVPKKYLKDDIAALTEYIDKAYTRLAWGLDEGAGLGWKVNPPKVKDWVDSVSDEGGYYAGLHVNDIFKRLTGTNQPWFPTAALEKEIGHTMRALTTVIKMPLASQMNAFQTLSTTLAGYNPKAYAKGVVGLLSKEQRKAIFNSGAIMRGTWQDWLDTSNITGWEKKMISASLQGYGHTHTERLNQLYDTNTAAHWARSGAARLHMEPGLLNKLRRSVSTLWGGNKVQIREQFRDLEIPEHLIAQMEKTGKTTKEIEQRVMQKSISKYQFAHHGPLTRPEGFETFPTFTQFYGFVYEYGLVTADFVKRLIPFPIRDRTTNKLLWGQAWKGGNVYSIGTHVVGGAIAADAVRSVRLMVAGRSIWDEDFPTRIANDLFFAGTAGIAAQFIETEGRASRGAWHLGPAMGDVQKIYRGLLGLHEFAGKPLTAKLQEYVTTTQPAARLLKSGALTKDYFKADRRVSDMLNSFYRTQGINQPKNIYEGTRTGHHTKKAREAMADDKQPEVAYGHIIEAIKAHMQENGSYLGAAVNSVQASIASSNRLSKIPHAIVPKGTDEPVRGRELFLDQLSPSQKEVLEQYEILHQAMQENAAEIVGNVMHKLVNSNLDASKSYTGEEIDEAMNNTAFQKMNE